LSEPRLELELVDQTGRAEPYLGLVRSVAERCLAADGLTGLYQLSITIVSDQRIRELNAEHRGLDAVTDVLSFPLQADDGASFVLPPTAPTHLGDVVVALGRAAEQAEEYGHSLERELAYLTVHGVLHLLGYDHEADDDREAMRAREEEVLVDLPR
jgi:probable rRNA maturation factor